MAETPPGIWAEQLFDEVGHWSGNGDRAARDPVRSCEPIERTAVLIVLYVPVDWRRKVDGPVESEQQIAEHVEID